MAKIAPMCLVLEFGELLLIIGSFFFAPPQNNISFEVHTKDSVDSDGDGVFDHLDAFPQDANELMTMTEME